MPPPNTLVGLITFPGIRQPISGEFCLSHGIAPSHAVIRCAPQSGLTVTDGAMIIAMGPDGGNAQVNIVFNDCRIDTARTQFDRSGFVTSVHILDRRWKWQFGEISGSYNVRFGSGFLQNGLVEGMLDPKFKKKPQELARLLLTAMGETDYDVSQLPSDDFPETHWANDNPAQALAALAEAYGCRVVLTLAGTVLIARLGVGGPLPSGGEDVIGVSAKLAETPDRVNLVCGKSRYQDDFPLYACGLDFDGEIVPIDKLSYKPAGGWESDSPDTFGSIDNTFNALGQSARQLALQTVYRWFQIRCPDTDGFAGFELAGYGFLNTIRQILPIEDEQVTQVPDSAGIAHNLPAHVYGIFSERQIVLTQTDPTKAKLYHNSFTIDRERGIVQFSEPVYLASGNQFLRPTLFLRTACSVRDPKTWSWDRFEISQPTGSQTGTKPAILKHDEIVYCNIGQYAGLQVPPQFLLNLDNLDAVAVESIYYLAGALQDYQPATGLNKSYAAFLPISPDGAIQQVTWTFGEGAKTQASLNVEHHPVVPPFRQRRFFEQLRGDVAEQLIIAAAKLRAGQPNPFR